MPRAGRDGTDLGIVTGAESNLPLQGVRVTLLGTQTHRHEQPAGRYTIANLAPGTYRIRTSAIGYTPVIIDSIPVRAGQTANADISLKHQTVRAREDRRHRLRLAREARRHRRDRSGRRPTRSSRSPTTNAIDAIKGRIAGVDIVTTGYKPGDGVRVRIRGTRSLKASNDPLYVLDGIPMAGGIGDLNPSDIESIEVLKDASATAIYGSRGANGVVLVTSTQGPAGNTRTTYDTYVGAQTVARQVEVFSGRSTPTTSARRIRHGGPVQVRPAVVSRADLPRRRCGHLLPRRARGAQEQHLHRLAGPHQPPGHRR